MRILLLVLAATGSLVAQQTPTWSADIAALVHRSCTPCHRPGQPAPFSLIEYDDVQKRASFVLDVVEDRYMPPWQPTHGEFVGNRRLLKQEIELLRRWVKAGAPRGDAAQEPEPPRFHDDWQLGRPDLIVPMPDVLEVPAEGADIVRNFVLPVAGDTIRYVSALEIRPSSPAVHHAVLMVDRTRECRKLDEQQAGPGFGGMTLGVASPPDGHFLGWTPGKSVRRAAAGMAWRLHPGDDLVLQLHAVPVGKRERVQAEIGIWFTDQPTRESYELLAMFSEEIDIAPGDDDFVVRDHVVVPVPVTVHALYPHAHYVCRRMQATAKPPGGDEIVLFAIDRWDFDWQDDYRYVRPITLPAGTRIEFEYVYDNSEANDNNPVRPLRRVRFGQESSDEMGTLTLSLTLAQRDLPALRLAQVDRELEKVPDAWNVLLRKGRLERERGNFDAARKAIEKACRISPGAADAWFEAGMLFEATRSPDRARQAYEQALSIDSRYAKAHLQLGSMNGRAGDNDAALRHFAQAVRLLPNSALAHNNFATANFAADRLPVAERHYRRAVALAPDYFNAQFNFGRVLLALGKQDEARTALQQAARLRPDVPVVKQLLQQLGK